MRGGDGFGDGDGLSRGFTLVEVLVSLVVIVIVMIVLVPLLLSAAGQVQRARRRSIAVWLASAKVEQLQALVWSVRLVEGTPVWMQDETTDLAWEPARVGGGGTRDGAREVFERRVVGYVEYLDANGRWIGAGVGGIPAGAAYERRWCTARSGAGGAELLRYQVAVADLVARRRRVDTGDWRTDPDIVWLSGARLRRAR